MLTHLVMVKFKSETPRAEIERIIAGLRSLPGRIPEIRRYELGEDIVHSERSFDFGLVGQYDDLAALKRYQEHPDHAPLGAALRASAERMVAVDFES
ncbi:MAG: Dabb family protein [Anaerolineae bacterium]